VKLNIRKLDIKKDTRGWLAELILAKDVGGKKFGQLGVTVARPGQIKGGHYHRRKREWFCVIRGTGLLTFKSIKTGETKELGIGENNMILVEIPKLHYHWIKNVGKSDMYLLFYTNEVFNPKDTDTFNE